MSTLFKREIKTGLKQLTQVLEDAGQPKSPAKKTSKNRVMDLVTSFEFQGPML
jgi:hypothetical protein